jgi:hypothetical protein
MMRAPRVRVRPCFQPAIALFLRSRLARTSASRERRSVRSALGTLDESPPPPRAAGAEIDAAFHAERLTPHVDFESAIQQSCLWLSGPIALLDAKVLGGNTAAKAKATLLGQALRIEHQVDSVEREILGRMGAHISLRELFRIMSDLEIDQAAVIAATRSLLRRQLVHVKYIHGPGEAA